MTAPTGMTITGGINATSGMTFRTGSAAPIVTGIGSDNAANAAEPLGTAWVLMDGPFYNTAGNPATGFQGGQSWRKMAPAATTNGRTDYIYGDERLYWDGAYWQYTNVYKGTLSTGTGGAYPWLATWTNNYTGAKITGSYNKTTNYPAVP
jgi:hypothetical protein